MTKIVLLRHADYDKISTGNMSAEVLTSEGVEEALLLHNKLKTVFLKGEWSGPKRAYSSPAFRAAQTANLLLLDGNIVLSEEIDETHYRQGLPRFVETVRGLPSSLTAVLVVTHAPVVGMGTAAFLGVPYDDEGPYRWKDIENCHGFLVDGNKATKI
jgi:phosphohistidine phosphatase SixA